MSVSISEGVLLAHGSLANGDGGTANLFVVDTAATLTIAVPELARSIGGRGTTGERLANKTLQLAGATVSHVPVSVLPLDNWQLQTGLPIAGIAGSDIFQNFAARIDYVHQLLTLIVPQSCALPNDRIPLRMAGGLPFLEATVQGVDGQAVRGLFLLDTGQSGPGVVLTSEFLAAHPQLAASLPGGTGRTVKLPTFDAAGRVTRTPFLRLAGMQIGTHPLKGVMASVAPPAHGGAGAQLAGVIGGGVLSHFDTLINLPQAYLSLTPNDHYSAPFEVDMSGILLRPPAPKVATGERNGQPAYLIAGIAENSPAADAGLQVGDRLLEVSGKQVNAMSMEMVREVFKSSPGTRLLVTVDRSGKKLQVTLTLRRAL